MAAAGRKGNAETPDERKGVLNNCILESLLKRLCLLPQSALVFWLSEGVDGIQLSGVEQVTRMVPSLWTDIRAIIQNGTDKYPNKRSEAHRMDGWRQIQIKRNFIHQALFVHFCDLFSITRVLIGVTDSSSADTVSDVLSSTGVDLLLSGVLSASNQTERAHNVQMLYSNHSQTKLAWSLEAPRDLNRDLVQMNQLLLMTLPGTPVFIGGEEIGLKDKVMGAKMFICDFKTLFMLLY